MEFSLFGSDTKTTKAPGVPSLTIIGGRLEDDNQPLFQEMHRLSGAKIAVFPTASREPEEVGRDTVEVFRKFGVEAEMVPLFHNNAAERAFDPEIVGMVERLGSVYFTGGDQSLIYNSLVQNGEETPVLKMIRQVHAAGGLIAGSSAGAAIMSNPMILGGTSLDALVRGRVEDPDAPGLPLGTGLGFFKFGLVDQHFLKRGRVGRLLVALRETGMHYGFGVDENTGMVIESGMMHVVGETGVLVVNTSQAEIAEDGSRWSNVLVSYLDHGDAYDLDKHQAIPHPSKKRIAVRRTSYTVPARSWRNIFGSYAFSELMVRLMEADPKVYNTDTASTYDSTNESEVAVTLRRVPRRTKALRSRAEGLRYTGLDFELDVARRHVSASQRMAQQRELVNDLLGGEQVQMNSQMICLGSTPARGSFELLTQLKGELRGPIGICAAAASDARAAARQYEDLFYDYGMEAFDLGISESTIGSANENAALIERIGNLGTIVFTGGNQRRLVETLLDRGRETRVLRAFADAYRRGASLVAVSGAASALSRVMIAGGGSYEALRYGIASHGDHSGITIDEGFGLFDIGILDQNLVHRNRLGRLIVACAEENSRFGFGLCEETGMVVPSAPDQPIRVFGRHGMVVVQIDHKHLQVQDDCFAARGVKLHLVRPGEAFDPSSGEVTGQATVTDETINLNRLLSELAHECRTVLADAPAGETGTEVHLRLTDADLARAVLDIQSWRVDA
ncbi:MAG TPA: cyanophycinase [Alphaproteobacteria bacterium]|nr:cyanophycinase [Alphaproteobacteria bacterium]